MSRKVFTDVHCLTFLLNVQRLIFNLIPFIINFLMFLVK
jgi:hypothetical protein